MEDYYSHTREVIDRYNDIINKIYISPEETNDEDDEFLQNFCIHLAHALIKDHKYGQTSRDELVKCANIIIDVIE